MHTQGQEEERPLQHFCEHGERFKGVIICSMPCEITSAWPSWSTAEKDGFIVTSHFCCNCCLWWAENGCSKNDIMKKRPVEYYKK